MQRKSDKNLFSIVIIFRWGKIVTIINFLTKMKVLQQSLESHVQLRICSLTPSVAQNELHLQNGRTYSYILHACLFINY